MLDVLIQPQYNVNWGIVSLHVVFVFHLSCLPSSVVWHMIQLFHRGDLVHFVVRNVVLEISFSISLLFVLGI